MKKAILLFAITFATIFKAQEVETPKYIYAEIVGTGKFMSHKVTIQIDYGQEVKFWGGDNRVRNQDGSKKEFNSMVDAMNYMGALGWEFQQAYVVTVPSAMGGAQNVYHWLLRKEYSKLEQNIQEELKKHMPTKQDLK